jgi:hypothetical protein
VEGLGYRVSPKVLLTQRRKGAEKFFVKPSFEIVVFSKSHRLGVKVYNAQPD